MRLGTSIDAAAKYVMSHLRNHPLSLGPSPTRGEGGATLSRLIGRVGEKVEFSTHLIAASIKSPVCMERHSTDLSG